MQKINLHTSIPEDKRSVIKGLDLEQKTLFRGKYNTWINCFDLWLADLPVAIFLISIILNYLKRDWFWTGFLLNH